MKNAKLVAALAFYHTNTHKTYPSPSTTENYEKLLLNSIYSRVLLVVLSPHQ